MPFFTAARAARIGDLITFLDVLPFFIFFFAVINVDGNLIPRLLHFLIVLRFTLDIRVNLSNQSLKLLIENFDFGYVTGIKRLSKLLPDIIRAEFCGRTNRLLALITRDQI